MQKFQKLLRQTNTSENYTREETTIFWTLDTKKWKTKTTDGRKDSKDKTQRKQRRTWTSDVTDWCGMSYTKYLGMAETRKEWNSIAANFFIQRWHPQ